jgi:hypothetical protein
LLPRPRLEVLPQTELLGDKAVLETVPEVATAPKVERTGPRVA